MSKHNFIYLFPLWIFILFFMFSCSSTQDMSLSKIENGGITTAPDEFSDKKTFYRNLSPGLTLAYWREGLLNSQYPPSFSNKAVTNINREYIVDVAFFGSETDVAEHGADIDVSSKVVEIDEATSRLISELRYLGITQKIMLSEVAELFVQLNIYQNYTLIQFLDELITLGLINRETYLRISEFAEANRLSLNISISEFIEFLKTNNIEIDVVLSELVQFVEMNELDYELDFDKIQTIIDGHNLDVNILSGKPHIRLLKIVDRETAYYGNDLMYTIKFKNVGDIPATDIVILDYLPIGLKFLGAKVDGVRSSIKTINAENNEVVRIKIKSLNPDENGEILIFTRIDG